MTDMLGWVVLVLVVATEADGDTEVDVDTEAYLATRSAVTPEEDTDDDMEDVSIVKEAEEVADEDTSILTGSELQVACAFQALPLPGGDVRLPPELARGVAASWLNGSSIAVGAANGFLLSTVL